MKFFVAVTDNAWFRFLADRKPDEVNFWRPGQPQGFHAIEPGAPFLFKLHSPENLIAGGGFFIRHSVLPISLAWKAFEEKNGVPTFLQFRSKIQQLGNRQENDPFIGCTILGEPFFFNRDEWIPVPESWSQNIVSGKTYDANEGGNVLWAAVQDRLLERQGTGIPQTLTAERQYGLSLTKTRLGQGAFRILVTEAYQRRCAVTGERTLPVLEACHIKPFAESGPNAVRNGLLLRSDLHILFDEGYMTVTPDYTVEVSRRIKEEFENGREYYGFHGKPLVIVPDSQVDHPSPELLDWHNLHKFQR